MRPPPQGETHAVIDGGVEPARLTFTAWGSPGCMRYPTSVAWSGELALEIQTAPSENTECSANYEPTSQVIELPTGRAAIEVAAVVVDGKAVPFTFKGEQ